MVVLYAKLTVVSKRCKVCLLFITFHMLHPSCYIHILIQSEEIYKPHIKQ